MKITEPAGDLPWRFAMPATAPIPPNPSNPDAVLGVADGHTTNYGRFIVGTGPYMFEGSENLDFSVDAKDQQAVSGYVPGRQIVLAQVRRGQIGNGRDGGVGVYSRLKVNLDQAHAPGSDRDSM